MQTADEIPEGFCADSTQGCGRFRFRWPMKFRMVPVQIAGKVAEVSRAHSRQSGRFPVQKPSKIFQAVGDHA